MEEETVAWREDFIAGSTAKNCIRAAEEDDEYHSEKDARFDVGVVAMQLLLGNSYFIGVAPAQVGIIVQTSAGFTPVQE